MKVIQASQLDICFLPNFTNSKKEHMSARGLIGFILNGNVIVSYNHCDIYPGQIEEKIVSFIESADLNYLRRKVQEIRFVDAFRKPSKEEGKRVCSYLGVEFSDRVFSNWYTLMKGLQGDLQAYVDLGIMINDFKLGGNSTMCEYGYVVNLDSEVLEAYVGATQEPDNFGAFSSLAADNISQGKRFFPIRLVGCIPIKDIKNDSEGSLMVLRQLSRTTPAGLIQNRLRLLAILFEKGSSAV